jgi:hypothetical protein
MKLIRIVVSRRIRATVQGAAGVWADVDAAETVQF